MSKKYNNNTNPMFNKKSKFNIKPDTIMNSGAKLNEAHEDDVITETNDEVNGNNTLHTEAPEPVSASSDAPSIFVDKQTSAQKKEDDKVSTSCALTSEASDVLKEVYKRNKEKNVNFAVNEILDICYDNETKTFKHDIPVKEVKKNVNYSIQITKKHKDALAKEAKKRKMTVGEYLSELITRTYKFN